MSDTPINEAAAEVVEAYFAVEGKFRDSGATPPEPAVIAELTKVVVVLAVLADDTSAAR